MIPPAAVLSPYSWSKIPRHRGYELKQNGELVGTLERPSMWSAIFIASAVGTKWIFRRSGFWRGGIEIVEAGSEQPIAVFQGTWTNRGVLRFSDGHTLTVECKGFCHPTWTLRSQTGEAVLWLRARERIAEVDSKSMLPDRRLKPWSCSCSIVSVKRRKMQPRWPWPLRPPEKAADSRPLAALGRDGGARTIRW